MERDAESLPFDSNWQTPSGVGVLVIWSVQGNAQEPCSRIDLRAILPPTPLTLDIFQYECSESYCLEFYKYCRSVSSVNPVGAELNLLS